MYDGFSTVKHCLLQYEDAGTLFVAGPPDAKHQVFFCAGFPCDHGSFIPLARKLAECGCLVGVSCMPEYDREAPTRSLGYDLHEIAICFGQAVAALREQSKAQQPEPTLTLVVHDWGIVPGFMHSNCVGCDKLVVFDVLPSNPIIHKPDRIYDAIVHLNYQSMFAISFWLSLLSPLLGRAWLTLGTTLVWHVFGRWLNPVGTLDVNDGMFGPTGVMPWQTPDKKMGGSAPMTPFRCYPYYHALKNAFNQPELDKINSKVSFEASLAKQPICYIYGAAKNTQFHLESFLTALRAKPGCAVHAVPHAGHWVYKHQPEVCVDAVRKFILGA